MKKLSLRGKIFIIATISIIVLAIIGIIVFKKIDVTTIATSVMGEKGQNRLVEEEFIEEVKEEVVVVPQDNTVGNLEDKIIKVASINDKEDPEKVKKKGGKKLSQDEAIAMFENTGVKSYGIDVSSNNGNIDWAAVKASGVDFAIIRAGYRGYVTGEVKEDPLFKTNAKKASANGIKVGAYFYSAAVNENEAQEEAIATVKIISTSKITYPVAYDSEEIARTGHRTAGVSGAQAANNANVFINHVRANGYEGMVYANISDMGLMGRGNFSCKYWLAHYVGSGQETTYKGSHQMWQYTSEGSVPGINGRVDMDIAYFSYGTEAAPKHEHKYTTLVGKEVKATCTTEGTKTMRCSCGDTETITTKPLGHKWEKWTVVESETEKVENKVKKTRKCSVCGTVETEEFSCEHNYKFIQNIEEATCENPGKAKYECTWCGHIEEKEIPKKEHDYKLQTPNKLDPTCTENGIREYKCKDCGDIKEETIPALGHKLGELIQDAQEKKQYKECERCKERFEEAPYEPDTTNQSKVN